MAKTNTTLHELFVTKLQTLLDVEEQIVDALPDMAEAATDEELVEAFNTHLGETRNHITRLEQSFVLLDLVRDSKKSHAIRGLMDDTAATMGEITGAEATDAALIAAAQAVEHYEMALYGTVCEWASLLGYTDIDSLLRTTLEEEKSTDEILNNLATSRINERADISNEEEE